MKKNILSYLLLLAMLLSLMGALPAAATEVVNAEIVDKDLEVEEDWRGNCGDNMIWELAGGTLTITGNGPMWDFDPEAPWAEHKDDIQKVILVGNITTVGSHAFDGYEALTEVDLGSAMHTLGACSFRFCNGLTRLHLPDTFRIFGFECLRECKNLTGIHCDGGVFPSFKGSCLWGTKTRIYYPANNPWPVSLVIELEDAFSGWIEFRDSNGKDPYVSGREGEADTDPALTAETTAPTTEPETQPTTEPTVPETTAPATEATTVPTEPETTAPPETTAAPTETEPTTQPVQWTMATTAPTEAAKRSANGASVGLALVGMVLSLIGAGTLIFHLTSKRDKY